MIASIGAKTTEISGLKKLPAAISGSPVISRQDESKISKNAGITAIIIPVTPKNIIKEVKCNLAPLIQNNFSAIKTSNVTL